MSSCSANNDDDDNNNNNNNNNNKCVPCSSLDDSARLSLGQAQAQLISSLSQPGMWTLHDRGTNVDNDPASTNTTIAAQYSLVRQLTAKNFQAALDAINAMGVIAEREGHHPDFHLTDYRNVKVEIFTHKIKGLTISDFVLANMLTEEVTMQYSPKWLKDHPEAQGTSSSKK